MVVETLIDLVFMERDRVVISFIRGLGRKVFHLVFSSYVGIVIVLKAYTVDVRIRRKGMDVRKIRSLQYVRRFNYERCNRYQSVAEHSAMVAVLAYEAANVLGWPQPAAYEAAFFALMHDAEEAVTGDILHLTKRALRKRGDGIAWLERQAADELGLNAPVPMSRERILELVEYCDVLELALYLQEEGASGNSAMGGILRETYGRLAANMFYRWLTVWTNGLLGFGGDLDFVSLLDLADPEPEFLKH